MLGHGKPLRAPSCKPSDLAGKGEFDRVDNAALARAVWSRNSELFLAKIEIELPDPLISSIWTDSSFIT